MNRKTARENAFILLFEGVCKSDETAEEIFDKAVSFRDFECDQYVKNVFFGVYQNLKLIDECIENSSVGWKRERISNVSIAILRLAIFEVLFIEDIPEKVSINEAIELSKKYDDEKTYMFVNGVLNAVVKSQK